MWHRTNQRKRFEIEWCEDQANIAFIRNPDFPGDPRDWEKKFVSPAVLTDLGQLLLGLKDW